MNTFFQNLNILETIREKTMILGSIITVGILYVIVTFGFHTIFPIEEGGSSKYSMLHY